MFQQIVDLIAAWWEMLLPCIVVDEYESGVILRLGRYHRTLGPGFHWKYPFLERYLGTTVVVTTMNLGSQSLTTKDGKNIVVSAIVKYHIRDVECFLLRINDAVDAIADVTMSKIRLVSHDTDWDDFDESADRKIEELVRSELLRWGIEIESGGIVLTDLQICRSFRLLMGQDSGFQNGKT